MNPTPENTTAVEQQVRRLKGANQGFPLDEDYELEVGRVCLRDFPTVDALRETVSHFLRTLTKLPAPAEFAQAALSYTGKATRQPCPLCEGVGFLPVRMVESTTGPIPMFEGVEPDEPVMVMDQSAGVRFCSCRAGMGGGR